MPLKKQLLKVLSLLTSFLVLGFFIMSFLLKETIESLVASEIRIYGLIFSFVASALLELIPQYIAPHFILVNNALIGFSGISMVLTIMVGSATGSFIGYKIGKKAGHDFICDLYGENKIKKIESLLNSQGKWFVAFAAISPLPYIPLIFGSLGMSQKNFIFFGLLPRAISFLIIWVFLAFI